MAAIYASIKKNRGYLSNLTVQRNLKNLQLQAFVKNNAVSKQMKQRQTFLLDLGDEFTQTESIYSSKDNELDPSNIWKRHYEQDKRSFNTEFIKARVKFIDWLGAMISLFTIALTIYEYEGWYYKKYYRNASIDYNYNYYRFVYSGLSVLLCVISFFSCLYSCIIDFQDNKGGKH